MIYVRISIVMVDFIRLQRVGFWFTSQSNSVKVDLICTHKLLLLLRSSWLINPLKTAIFDSLVCRAVTKTVLLFLATLGVFLSFIR